jgi:hypothetical protein
MRGVNHKTVLTVRAENATAPRRFFPVLPGILPDTPRKEPAVIPEPVSQFPVVAAAAFFRKSRRGECGGVILHKRVAMPSCGTTAAIQKGCHPGTPERHCEDMADGGARIGVGGTDDLGYACAVCRDSTE